MVAQPDTKEIYAYCLGCRDSKLMLNPERWQQRACGKSTRLAHRGTCSGCGKVLNTIGFGVMVKPMPPKEEPTPPEARTECPRCEGWLEQGSDYYGHFYLCLTCGWTAEAPAPEERPRLTSHFIRYLGTNDVLRDKVVVARVGKTKLRRCGLIPQCPWCDEGMEEMSLTGKRKYKQETRYKCPQGHRISLMDGETLTWR